MEILSFNRAGLPTSLRQGKICKIHVIRELLPRNCQLGKSLEISIDPWKSMKISIDLWKSMEISSFNRAGWPTGLRQGKTCKIHVIRELLPRNCQLCKSLEISKDFHR